MKKNVTPFLLLFLVIGISFFTANASRTDNNLSGLFKLKISSEQSQTEFHSVYYENGFAVYFGNRGVHYVSTASALNSNEVSVNRLDVDFQQVSEQMRLDFASTPYNTSVIRKSINGELVDLIPVDTIRYTSIYNNIDLVYFINDNRELSYNFQLKKQADLSDIQLYYSNNFINEIDEVGDLKITTNSGYFSESAPITFKGSKERRVESSFILSESNLLSFYIKNFDNSKEYVIDPQINWTTYLGGAGSDIAGDMAIDDSSNVYITGSTLSNDFPTTTGAFQLTRDAVEDAFVSKFDSLGNLLWSTYYGGEAQDEAYAIAVTGEGTVFITGITRSLSLPNTYNVQPGNGSAFIAVFENDGSIVNARYLGGDSDDEGRGLVTIGDTVYATGFTGSTNFPVAGIGSTTIKKTGDDIFLTALNDTAGIVWSQYYGGTSGDRALTISKDFENNLIIAGETESVDLPVSITADQATKNASDDAFLAKFSQAGLRTWSTYYGGDGLDRINSIDVDSANNIYVVGSTASTDLEFPTNGTTFQDTLGGGLLDILLMRYDENGVTQWGTYYGSAGSDEGKSIAINQGAMIITGETESSNLSITSNASQATKDVGIDGFNIQFDTSGTRIYASFMGGNQNDFGKVVAFQPDFLAYYILGNTRSTNFPPISNAYQSTNNGDNDIFIIKSCGLLPNNTIAAAGLDTLILCTNEAIPAIIGSTPIGGSEDYTYQYQVIDTNTNAFVDLNNSNSVDFTPDEATLIVGFNTFRRIVSDGNCSDTSGITVIDYREAANANFGFVNSCTGDSVQFSDSSTVATNDRITGWLWTFGDGATSNLQNPLHAYSTAGNYDVLLTVTTEKGAFNCFGRSQQTITINESPIADFTFSSACAEESIQFTNTSSNIIDTLYSWNFGDGTTSQEESPVHEFATAGTYQVQLIIGANNTCSDTVTQQVVVDSKPVANFINSNTTCTDSVITFTDQSTPVANIASWNWSFGDGDFSTDQNPSHTYLGSGIFSVRLIVTSNAGCMDTLIKRISVGLPPSVDFTSTSECVNQETSFEDNSQSSIGTINQRDWNFGDGNTSTEENPINVYATTGSYTVTLTVTTSEGCINSASKTITVNDLPTVTAGNDETIIKGESERITATSNEAGSYSWTSLNSSSPINVQDPTVSPRETTVYTVRFTNSDGCFAIDSLKVIVLPSFFIPSAFTPDNDGDNDKFEVQGINRFPNHEVEIFNRWGAQLYRAKGNYQDVPWDGTFEGEEMGLGAYYYIIDLKNGTDPFKGTITILR